MWIAEDTDNGWVADWLSAFSDKMNEECDESNFEHSNEFSEDYNGIDCMGDENARYCFYYYSAESSVC